MTFTQIFVANDIDKIPTLSNESALPLIRGSVTVAVTRGVRRESPVSGASALCD
jgi:hypothetical protein